MPTTAPPDTVPTFASAGEIFAVAAEALRWPEPVAVHTAAELHRVLENPGGGYSGPWRNDLAPHLVRPMECLSSGEFRLVVVQGPAQSGKSEIANNWLLGSIIYDAADFMWLQTSRDMMRDYVHGRIDQMIRLCPEARRRQIDDRSADTTFAKRFFGMAIYFVWPVKGKLQSYPVPRFVVDDYDRIPENIDGEGSALKLLEARQTTFEGSEVGFVTSSPSLGPTKGIEGLRVAGTDERFVWPCPHCGEFFEPAFDRDLVFDHEGTPEDAKGSAFVRCPTSGCIIEQQEKAAMLARGKWIGPGQTINSEGEVEGEIAANSVASFRVDGLIGFSSWGRLAELYRSAELKFELAQDESDLRSFYNTRGGKNYRSKVEDAEPLAAHELADRRDAYPLGAVPAGVEVLTAAVDVQGDRFEVEVKGWGENFESWIVDRFAVLELEDGRTRVKPDQYPEHWRILLTRVFFRRYPVATGGEIPILTTAIDTGGLPGVSQNATKFWHIARELGVPELAIMLLKGGNNPRAKLLPPPTYLEVDGRGRPKKSGARLWVPNVAQAKDIIDVRLRRAAPGPGYIHFPNDLADGHFDELAAEEKQAGKWVKIAARNETLDLEVYNLVAFVRTAGEGCNLAKVPTWARRPPPDPEAAGAEQNEPQRNQEAAGESAPAAPADHPFSKQARSGRRRGRRGGVRG